MQNNIFEYIEDTASRLGEKTAITEGEKSITFSELERLSKAVATSLCLKVKQRDKVIILMEKSIEYVTAMLACAQTGAVYIPLDPSTPTKRIKFIIEKTSAGIILRKKGDSVADLFADQAQILCIEDLEQQDISEEELSRRRERILVTDPLYMLFTSGSTGKPKGIITSHLALISFIDAMAEKFAFTSEDALANQVPFYFDASTKDIYLMCKCGCTMHIIPKKLFMDPKNLMMFLNEKRITRIIWTPFLFCLVANLNAFEKVRPEYLKTVCFVGEQMPTKQMNMWRRCLPDVQYVNLYGSSEVSGSSAYYIIQRDISDDEVIPVGVPFRHMDVFLLDDDDNIIEEEGCIGEICVRGPSLSFGYYGDIPGTERAFSLNPETSAYREYIYRSGDLGKYNSHHELIFVSRRDHQIKRLGQRIELGEIETAISSLDGIGRCCCLYDERTKVLYAVYEGTIDPKDVSSQLRDIIPDYMIPSEYHQMDAIPLNANAKIDRQLIHNLVLQNK